MSEMKKCNGKLCNGLLKVLNDFYKDKSHSDGYKSICKVCDKMRRNLNAQKFENKEKKNKSSRSLYIRNKEKRSTQIKKWQKNNKEKVRLDQNIYQNNKRKTDICFRFRQNISSKISFYLKQNNGSKNNSSTWKHLPYTPRELREHLEKQFTFEMSWDNYGSFWEIDHILPQSKLPFDSFEHPNFLKCWSLENLRPLYWVENVRKGNKII